MPFLWKKRANSLNKDWNQITSKYIYASRIGGGSFGDVYSCTKAVDRSQCYAVKVVRKWKPEALDEDPNGPHRTRSVVKEMDILKDLNHPNIVKFEEKFDMKESYAFVMELAPGGALFDRLADRTTYSEANARTLIRILLDTMAYVHERNVCHRDLKPDNLVLGSDTDDTNGTHIKLIDFGLATRVMHKDQEIKTMCGTRAFSSPELLSGQPYKISTDVFAVGIIAFQVLGGYHPFATSVEDLMRVVSLILKGEFEFHPQAFHQVSDNAKDVITMMLDKNPDTRVTCREALQHQWFKEDAADMARRDLTSSIIGLQAFCSAKTEQGHHDAFSEMGRGEEKKHSGLHSAPLPSTQPPPAAPGSSTQPISPSSAPILSASGATSTDLPPESRREPKLMKEKEGVACMEKRISDLELEVAAIKCQLDGQRKAGAGAEARKKGGRGIRYPGTNT